MRPRIPILAVAATTVALAGCITITGAPLSLQGVAPAGKSQALNCAIQQLIHLGYTIEAGDGAVGFVRGEKHLSADERFFLPGTNERDVLTATVFDEPTTGSASLSVTAALRTHSKTGAPTKRGSADADSIMATCAGQTASGSRADGR